MCLMLPAVEFLFCALKLTKGLINVQLNQFIAWKRRIPTLLTHGFSANAYCTHYVDHSCVTNKFNDTILSFSV
jgi:hypothetical protein